MTPRQQSTSERTGSVLPSDIVSDTTEIEIENFRDFEPHVFVGAQFFSDAAGNSPVVPTSGDVVYSLRPVTTNQYEPFPTSTVSADTPETVSASAPPLTGIKAVPSAIVGAGFWRIVIANYTHTR